VTHAGQVYAGDREDAVRIGRHEGEIMVSTARELERAGSGPLQVGLGSTPTIFHAASVDGVDEIHPGVYVFGDREQVRLGAMAIDDIALTVLGTVVSRPARGRWILDTGSKTLSGDRGAHGNPGLEGYGAVRSVADQREVGPDSALPFSVEETRTYPEPPATITRLSEEHGVIESDRDLGWKPGDRVEILPNHACSAVNLARVICVTEGQGDERRVTTVWPVAARARVQ
jgi:D-serine deaminase-like pyridoxal phosphate-dependent protein